MLIMNGKDITPKHSKTLSVKVDEFKNKSKTRFGFVVIRDTHGVWNAVRRGEVEAKGADLEHIDTYLSLKYTNWCGYVDFINTLPKEKYVA